MKRDKVQIKQDHMKELDNLVTKDDEITIFDHFIRKMKWW
jgi:hypothetical protein